MDRITISFYNTGKKIYNSQEILFYPLNEFQVPRGNRSELLECKSKSKNPANTGIRVKEFHLTNSIHHNF